MLLVDNDLMLLGMEMFVSLRGFHELNSQTITPAECSKGGSKSESEMF